MSSKTTRKNNILKAKAGSAIAQKCLNTSVSVAGIIRALAKLTGIARLWCLLRSPTCLWKVGSGALVPAAPCQLA